MMMGLTRKSGGREMSVRVIEVPCYHHSRDGWRSFGDSQETGKFDSAEDAIKFGNTRKAEKVCVIVRPDYNETDERGRTFYREWRSFGGEDFRECRWSYDS